MTAVSALRLMVRTANVDKAGTDDAVWFDIGKTRWRLNNPGRNDFERGHEDSFDLPTSSLQDTDLWRLLICKSADGQYGGWKLDGVRVLVNGAVRYEKQSIGKWLENEGSREWIGSDFTAVGPVPASVVISEATIRGQIQAVLDQLSSSELKPLGSLTMGVDCGHIHVKQKFEAEITGPNPDITLSVRFVPVLKDGRIEVVIASTSVDVDYPWWFEAASGVLLAEIIERRIERDLKDRLKTRIKTALQAEVDRSMPAGIVKQVCLRPHKIEIFI